MATLDRSQSAASELAVERFRLATELAIEGRSPYPDGAAFLAADLPNLGEVLGRYARERRPAVLVYPDGEERVLTSDQNPVVEAMASEPVREQHHHHHSGGVPDHARELGDVLVLAFIGWVLFGAPYAQRLGVPELAHSGLAIYLLVVIGGLGFLFLESLSNWLADKDREGLRVPVRLTIRLLSRLLSAIRLGVGLAAAGALGTLGAKLVLGL